MSNEPSALDQVVRHWPPRELMWRGHRVRFDVPRVITKALSKGIGVPAIDIQNANDYMRDEAHRLGATDDAPKPMTRDLMGRPPFDECVMFWRCPRTEGGYAYVCCLLSKLADGELGRGVSSWFGITFQYETGLNAGPYTMPTGAFVVAAQDANPAFRIVSIYGYTPEWATCGSVGFERARLALSIGQQYLRTMMERSIGSFATDVVVQGAKSMSYWGIDSLKDATTVGYAVQFMSCKNVQVRNRGFTSPPVRWLREGHPRLRYHILCIDPKETPGIVGTRRDPDKARRGLSLHIVRGHFANYTPDRPLFGKYVGQFWVPQHARGDAEAGTVHKDYKLG